MPKIGLAGASIMMCSWLEALRVAAAHKYEAFEVFGEFPQTDLDAIDDGMKREARKIAADAGVEICVHAPFTSVNIAAFNDGIREESVRQQIQAVNLCADLGGQAVIVHNGCYIFYKSINKNDNAGINYQWELNIENLRRMAEHAAGRGVTVCLENVCFVEDQIDRSLDDLIEIHKAVDNSALEFCLDIGHARLAQGVLPTIAALSPHIRHVHFTDNLGQDDDHMTIGEGNFDYTPFLDFIRGFPYIVTLEVVKVGTDPAAALKSREYFQNLIK